TLLSSGHEVQYVSLCNILLIIQLRPEVLRNNIKVFFYKYNNPIYVKLAKLEIMFRLANVDQALSELKEYATEIDVSVRSIVQEAIVVIKSIIGILCENLDNLYEPEAKATMIWIIGQYADRIENSDVLLDGFLFTFLPIAGQELIPKVLNRQHEMLIIQIYVTEDIFTGTVVLSDKPQISTESDNMEPAYPGQQQQQPNLLDSGIDNLASLGINPNPCNVDVENYVGDLLLDL
ncbi:14973_t:CDS:2, partial [Dentiscutata erythropus]